MEGFYSRLTKVQLVCAVSEAKAPMQVSIGSLKQHEAVRYIAAAMAESGWLPKPLRPASVPVHVECAA